MKNNNIVNEKGVGDNRTAPVNDYRAVILFGSFPLENKSVPVFGIRFEDDSGTICEFADLTHDKKTAEQIAELFTVAEIDRRHIADVIEDIVACLHFYERRHDNC